MKLFDNPASPFARKVKVVLLETGQLADVELETVAGHPTDPMPVAENPLGKIPTLIRADGPALYDSRVICRFFNDKANARLYPEHRIWESLTLESTGDGIMDAAVLMVYEGRSRPENMRYEPWVDGQWAKVMRALNALETKWMSHLHGPLDIGQISVACALGYLDFRHSDRDWRGPHGALAAWHARFCERESMKRTEPHLP